MKVLIADDDPVSRALLSVLVAREGCEPVCASDGQEAWERFRAGDIRVVLTDRQMPRLDGLDLLRRIRSQPGPYTYTILLTSPSQSSSTAVAAGADDFLAKPVDDMALRTRLAVARRIASLQEELARRNAELEQANARMHQDLRTAERAQRLLLPPERIGIPGLSAAWRLSPCEELAGDTLNVVELDWRHVGFYVLDVSGHGVGAALMAVQLARFLDPRFSSVLRSPKLASSEHRIVPPAEVAVRLAELFHSPGQLQYCTLLYGVLDRGTRRVDLVCAAHPPPVLLRADGRTETPDIPGHPIGLFPADESVFSTWSVTLEPGDRLLVCSDGVTETEDSGGDILGSSGLTELAARHHGLGLDALLDALMADLAARRHGRSQADDVSLLVLECP